MRNRVGTRVFQHFTSLLFAPVIVGCAGLGTPSPDPALQGRWAVVSDRLESHEASLVRLSNELSALRRELEAARVAANASTTTSPRASRASRSEPRATPAAALQADAEWDDPSPAKSSAPPRELADSSAMEGETIADSSQQSMHFYYQALSRIENRQYEDALKSLRQFLDDSPEHVYADRAQFLIAKAHFLNQDYGLVLVATNLLETRYPHSLKIPDALYQRALALEHMGSRDQAKNALKALVERFPNHRLATTATRTLGRWKTKLASPIPLIDDAT